MKKIISACCRLMCVALLMGCTVQQELPTPTPTPTPTKTPEPVFIETPVYGGLLRLSMRLPLTFNPLINEDVTVDKILRLVFLPLLTLDDQLMPVAEKDKSLAKSFERSADGLSITIVLDDYSWEDGKPVTAKDVEYSLRTIENAPTHSIYKDCVSNISRYSVKDEKTIVISYDSPYGPSPYRLVFPVIPEHYYKSKDITKMSPPVGNGLYSFLSYEPLRELRLTSSQNFKPYIKDISVIVTADAQTDNDAFAQGIIDTLPSQLIRWGRFMGTKEMSLNEYTSSQVEFLGFNHEDKTLSDKRTRQAIAHLIPVERILTEVYSAHIERSLSLYHPSSYLYEKNLTKYDGGLEAAEPLIKEVGDYSSESLNLSLLVNQENEERLKTALIIKESVAALGINIEIIEKEFEDYTKALDDGDFDLFLGGYELSVIPDLSFALHSSSVAHGMNYFRYKNESLDSLLSLALTSSSEQTFKQASSQIQRFCADELPLIVLGFKKSALLTDKRIRGKITPNTFNLYSNINEWYIR